MTESLRLWHVTVTVAGTAMEPLIVRAALQRFSEERPFLSSIRFAADRAEITYWDEAESLIDAASLALRVWNEHRDTARLPMWQVVGLEVVEEELKHSREQFDGLLEVNVMPMPF